MLASTKKSKLLGAAPDGASGALRTDISADAAHSTQAKDRGTTIKM
jgi:hypothetical protein